MLMLEDTKTDLHASNKMTPVVIPSSAGVWYPTFQTPCPVDCCFFEASSLF